MITSTATHVQGLPPVSLPELVEVAALLSRVDRKYVVTLDDLPELIEQLPAGTRVLAIEDQREFGYRSTYLDTPDRRSYLSSGRNERGRWKVRGRTYVDTGGSWLELKTAGPRGRTVKQRLAHRDLDDHGMSADGLQFVAAGIGSANASLLRPVLTTTYRRTTLLLPTRARVTVDAALSWQSRVTGEELRRPRLVVVETKAGATPSPVDRQLWARGHRPVRISKFGTGMAALDTALPRLKWHRVLARHLDLPLNQQPRS